MIPEYNALAIPLRTFCARALDWTAATGVAFAWFATFSGLPSIAGVTALIGVAAWRGADRLHAAPGMISAKAQAWSTVIAYGALLAAMSAVRILMIAAEG
jgi:hypothetical protein